MGKLLFQRVRLAGARLAVLLLFLTKMIVFVKN